MDDGQNYDSQDRASIAMLAWYEDEIDESHRSQLKYEYNVYVLSYRINI